MEAWSSYVFWVETYCTMQYDLVVVSLLAYAAIATTTDSRYNNTL